MGFDGGYMDESEKAMWMGRWRDRAKQDSTSGRTDGIALGNRSIVVVGNR